MIPAAFTSVVSVPNRSRQAATMRSGMSGAVTSGLGYVLWYRLLTHIPAITAAVVQLCVPLLAAAFGVRVYIQDIAAACARPDHVRRPIHQPQAQPGDDGRV